ncbi:thermonuclease family protein [Labrenzia sp. DG1229]|uniref:thermonuclease family protein n=1 Tax=Labrenzia sp. DG1229 TaxID=681847 RepID=UPI0004914701|nr:thermonuclease family protein [Labrenzia sp. DG1229]
MPSRILVSLTLLAMSLLALPIAIANSASVSIVDGDTIDVDSKRIRLHGIDAPEAGQSCKKAGGGEWPCGRRAIEELEQLIGDESLNCNDLGTDDFGRTLSVCYLGPIDINEVMVRNGFAWSFRKYASDYNDVEDQARKEQLGVWQRTTQTPWEFRARRWEVAEQSAPDGCPIKGNISRNGRIYHAPWSPWYSRTKIDTSKGERWFCDEAEATSAGWRAPFWGSR